MIFKKLSYLYNLGFGDELNVTLFKISVTQAHRIVPGFSPTAPPFLSCTSGISLVSVYLFHLKFTVFSYKEIILSNN